MKSINMLKSIPRKRIHGSRISRTSLSDQQRFIGRFELLEDRYLLAANILATLDGNVPAAGQTNDLMLDVQMGGATNVLGIFIQATGAETLDPAAAVVRDDMNNIVAPILAEGDLGSSDDSLVIIELPLGEFVVEVGGENNTSGTFQIDVFLPGDLSPADGIVDSDELLFATAALMQHQFGFNHVSQQFFSQRGVDVNQNLYREEIDANMNGVIDPFDLDVIERNVNSPPVVVELIGDDDPPVIMASLDNDTGRSDTDGITKDATIVGTIADESNIVSFTGGFDDPMNAGDADLLGDVSPTGEYTFDLTRLEQIAGGPVENTGSRTLFLTSEDEFGNANPVPFSITFELDTKAPAVPAKLDLTSGSDTGISDSDDLTSDNTPTIATDAEDGALVELFSDLDGPIGQNVVKSPVLITTGELVDGTHSITGTATDLAGNTSPPTDPLVIEIDTQGPSPLDFDLDPADDTGVPGDNLTTLTSVAFNGQTEASVPVILKSPATSSTTVALSIEVDENAHTWQAFAEVTEPGNGLGIASFQFDVFGTGGLTVLDSTSLGVGPNFSLFPSTGSFGIGINASQNTIAGGGVGDMFVDDQVGLGSPVLLASGVFSGSSGTLTVAPRTSIGNSGIVLFNEEVDGVSQIETDFAATVKSDSATIGDTVVDLLLEVDDVNNTWQAFAEVTGADDALGIASFEIDVIGSGGLAVLNNTTLEVSNNFPLFQSSGTSGVGIHASQDTIANGGAGAATVNDRFGAGSRVLLASGEFSGTEGTLSLAPANGPAGFVLFSEPVDGITTIDTDFATSVNSDSVTVGGSEVDLSLVVDKVSRTWQAFAEVVDPADAEGIASFRLDVIGSGGLLVLDDTTLEVGSTFPVLREEGDFGVDIHASQDTVANGGAGEDVADSFGLGNRVLLASGRFFGTSGSLTASANRSSGNSGFVLFSDPADGITPIATEFADRVRSDTVSISDTKVDLSLEVDSQSNSWQAFAEVTGSGDLHGIASFRFDVLGSNGLTVTNNTSLEIDPTFPLFQSTGTNGVDITASQDTISNNGVGGVNVDGQFGVGSRVLLASGEFTGTAGTLRIVPNTSNNNSGFVLFDKPVDHVTEIDTEFATKVITGNIGITTSDPGAGLFGFDDFSLPFGPTAFEAVATDAAGNQSRLIQDFTRNDAPAAMDDSFSVGESSPAGLIVGTVSATDSNVVNPADMDMLSFEIVGGNLNSGLSVNRLTGDIIVAKPELLDFEALPTFDIEIEVTDHGSVGHRGVSLSDIATITINVDDDNEAPDVADQVFSIAENSAAFIPPAFVQASDQDAGDMIEFSVAGGSGLGVFDVDKSSGMLTVKDPSALNFENVTSFDLIIEVTDVAGLSSFADLTIDITDVNEAPEINAQTFDIDENSLLNSPVGTVVASDVDAGDVLQFSIIGGTGATVFDIDPSNGLLTVLDPLALDFETNPFFSVDVQVKDQNGAGLTDSATITIDLNDLNEAPEINAQSFNLQENSPPTTPVGMVIAKDPDAGDSLSYAITGGNTGNAFDIDSKSGEISVLNSAPLDFETAGPFELTVEVTDTGSPGLKDSATVTINLDDVNEAPSVADNQMFNIAPPPQGMNGDLVGSVVASDPDQGDMLTYDIIGGNMAGIFDIGKSSGDITVLDANKLVDKDVHLLTVEVSDILGLMDSSIVTVTVVANEPPTADDDTAATNEETAIDIDVLTGDDDPDGNNANLTVVDNFAAGSTLGATLSLNPNNTINYDPSGSATLNSLSLGETTKDTFTYQALDELNDPSLPATVTVTVTGLNDTPIAKDDTVSTDEDTLLSFDPLADNSNGPDTDPDSNDVLSVSSFDSTSTEGSSITLNPNGTFTYDPTSSASLNQLPEGDIGSDTFTYTITDSLGGFSTADVTILVTGVNDAPQGVNDNAGTDEDTAIDIDVINGPGADTDPDNGDVLTVGTFDMFSAQGAAIILNPNGTLNYDPSVSSSLNSLSQGQMASDSFSYEVLDFLGADDTATVMLDITGVNDAPTAQDDSASTNEGQSIIIDALADNGNGPDTDPDTNDILSINSFDSSSDLGATITQNPNGTFTYDPSSSAALNMLALGVMVDDTFTYEITDSQGGFDSGEVTVTVTGVDLPPQLTTPLADLIRNDVDGPPPTIIDLNNHFFDPNGGTLTFMIDPGSSINTDVVDVQLAGDMLTVTYNDYATGQDRSMSDVIIKASNPSGMITDDFTITVAPETTLLVELIVREDPSTLMEANGISNLPFAETEVLEDDDFVLEVWVKDLLTPTITDGAVSDGFTGGAVDVGFDPNLSQATNLNHDGLFQVVPIGTIDNITGLIDDFGGANIADDVGVDPQWVRLGYVEYLATDSGMQDFTLDVEQLTRKSRVDGTITGTIDESQIDLTGTSVEIIEVTTFEVIPGMSNIVVTGTVDGAPLDPQQIGVSDRTSLSGEIDVRLDNTVNPMLIDIFAADIDLDDSGTWEPDVGGLSGSAPGELGFRLDFIEQESGNGFPAEALIAVREFLLDIETLNALSVNPAGEFSTSMQSWEAFDGFSDVRVVIDVNGFDVVDLMGRFDASGTDLVDDGSPDSTIINDNGTLILTIPIMRTMDFMVDDSDIHLDLNGTIVAEFDLNNPLFGTGDGSNPVDNGIFVSLAKTPTPLDENGQVSAVPASQDWIDEWDSYWIEVWVNTNVSSGVTSAGVDLSYDSQYFTATEIDHEPIYVENTSGAIDDSAGHVSNLGGSTSRTDVGSDGFALLGRVKFEALAQDQTPIVDNMIGPYDLGLQVSENAFQAHELDSVEPVVGEIPETELWAVVYDIDDSDTVDFADLSFFAAAFEEDILESNVPFAWALDFDNNSIVDFGDFSFLSVNFRKSKGDGSEVQFPVNFLQAWVGMDLQLSGESSIDQLVTAAAKTWQDALGLSEPIDVQLVVQDFTDSQLGESKILEVNSEGIPTRGRVIIDNDADGLGWHAQLDGALSPEMYDLYTVLLHEIGHALGFTSNYSGFAEHLVDTGSETIFVGSGFSATFDIEGQHLDSAVHPDDLMNDSLPTAQRRLPSALDIQILQASHAAKSAEISAGSSALYAQSQQANSIAPVMGSSNSDLVSFTESDLIGSFRITSASLGEEDDSSAKITSQNLLDRSFRQDEEYLRQNGIAVSYPKEEQEQHSEREILFTDWESNSLEDLELLTKDLHTKESELLANSNIHDSLFADWNDFEKE